MKARCDTTAAALRSAQATLDELTAAQAADEAELARLEQRLAETTAATATAAAAGVVFPPEAAGADRVMAQWGEELGAGPDAAYQELAYWGIRSFGPATCGDYPIIADNVGDPSRWGFTHDRGGASIAAHLDSDSGYGTLAGSDYTRLDARDTAFIDNELTVEEREALRLYAGPGYADINAAYTGSYSTARGRMHTPDLDRAFAKHRDAVPAGEPATLVRGTGIPETWGDDDPPDVFLAAAYPIGARVEPSCIASTSTDPDVAAQFAGDAESDAPYVMAIRARSGLAVQHVGIPGEREVLLAPGTPLRVVDREDCGVGGLPTVYLVGEDLAAQAQHDAEGHGRE